MMREFSFRGALKYDEIVLLEVACLGEEAVTEVQFDQRLVGPYWTVREGGKLIAFMNARADARSFRPISPQMSIMLQCTSGKKLESA